MRERIDERGVEAAVVGHRLHREPQVAERVLLLDLAPPLPPEHRRRVDQHDALHDRIAREPDPLERARRAGRDGVVAGAGRGEHRGLADAHLGRVEDRLEQRVLALEVVVERPAAHPGGVEDRLDRRGLEAALGEEARRLGDELLARRLAPVLASIHGRPSTPSSPTSAGLTNRLSVQILDRQSVYPAGPSPDPGSEVPPCPSNASIRHRIVVPTPLGDVAAIDTGRGDAALFVHGVGTNAHLWAGVLDALADEHRCVAIDLPGHGRSPVTDAQDLTISGLADLVEAFCATHALDRVDLVAHDTGGAVAQVFAARHPERMRSFVLTNCDCHDNIPPAGVRADGRARPPGPARTAARPDCSPTRSRHATWCSPWATRT